MWKPGQSGNPKGRPRGEDTLARAIREALAKKDRDGRTALTAIVDRAVWQAKRGNRYAREWLSERAFGKPVQPITGEDGPLEIIVRYAKSR